MIKKAFLGVFVIFFLMALVNAQPPFEENVGTLQGLQLFEPRLEVVKQEASFNLHMHVSNITNGVQFPNTAVDCKVHLYDNTGNHTFESGVMEKDSNGFDHEIFISSGNFSRLGEHAYYIFCNSSNPTLGGEVRGNFEVTKTGTLLDTGEALTYFILAFGVLLLFALGFYFMVALPYENEVNEKGAVIKITKLKYVKLGFVLLTWILLTWFLNILIGLADNFVSLTMYYGFFGFMFQLMNSLAWPIGIIILVIALFELVKDFNLYENIKKLGSALK